jgi:hypothetical protein
MFVEVLQGYGGFWINPTTQEVGLDKPEAIAAVRFLAAPLRTRFLHQKLSPTVKTKPWQNFSKGMPYFFGVGLLCGRMPMPKTLRFAVKLDSTDEASCRRR